MLSCAERSWSLVSQLVSQLVSHLVAAGSARNSKANATGATERSAAIQKTERRADSLYAAVYTAPSGDATDSATKGHISTLPKVVALSALGTRSAM
jgi:hypothetical protein